MFVFGILSLSWCGLMCIVLTLGVILYYYILYYILYNIHIILYYISYTILFSSSVLFSSSSPLLFYLLFFLSILPHLILSFILYSPFFLPILFSSSLSSSLLSYTLPSHPSFPPLFLILSHISSLIPISFPFPHSKYTCRELVILICIGLAFELVKG